ncbi:MAG: hypothetical protein ACREJ0_28425, partial [Geminicoccaceae bacterium]
SMDRPRPDLWMAGWSRKRRAWVFALGLLMTYLHSVYILAFYVPEEEYWFPFWTGMTVADRLLSFLLAFIANFGLLAVPFLRTPGRWMRVLLVVCLCWGALISTAWLARDIIVMGLYPLWPMARAGLIEYLIVRVFAYVCYITALYLYLKLLIHLRSSPGRNSNAPAKHARGSE